MRAPLYADVPDALFARDAIDDPHALYAELREKRPLARIAETGVHLVATWDLIEEVLRREADFSAHLTGVLIRDADGAPTTFALPGGAATQVIATADEPRHGVHRKLSQPRLTAPQAAKLEPALRDWTRRALARWLEAGGGDIVPIAENLPARVVAEVLGLPAADVPRFRTWSMMGGDMLAGDVDAHRLATLARETGEMTTYLGEHFDLARDAPQQGTDAPLLHALARGVAGGAIVREEALGIATVMFGAGGESTAALLGSVVRRLAEEPALADALRASPDQIPRFVEEVVRLEPPFKFHYRAVKRRCRLAGHDLEPGDRLMLLWAAANRDPAHVEDPDTLRLDRRHPKDHLGFGRGAHFCIGAPFARLEARILGEELLAATSALALRPEDPPVYANSIFVRRLERLPIAATPAVR